LNTDSADVSPDVGYLKGH